MDTLMTMTWLEQHDTRIQTILVYLIQHLTSVQYYKQESQLSLTNRATRLEVIQGQQTCYHSI